jgi:hypothetical protein
LLFQPLDGFEKLPEGVPKASNPFVEAIYLLPRVSLFVDARIEQEDHGNRSQRAIPLLRGMICGLRLSAGINDLTLL